MTTDQKIAGLLGLLVGDALGVPYEFHDPRNLPPADALEMTPPAGFRRSHAGTPPGTWSDDGAHALALLDSLVTCGGFDPEDFGTRLRAWWSTGAYAVGGRVFDVGNQTSAVLARLEAGTPAAAAGLAGERDNGNGSLMRALPLALWFSGPDAALCELAAAQSRVTHAHPRSQACCALYTAWARSVVRGEPLAAAVDRVRAALPDAAEIDAVLAFGPPRGSGYVVDTFATARVCLDAGPYDVAVRRAIGFGLDTDTTACVVGGLAALRDGADAIPRRWRSALGGRDVVEPIVHRWLGDDGLARWRAATAG